jgi:hypothetical protein
MKSSISGEPGKVERVIGVPIFMTLIVRGSATVYIPRTEGIEEIGIKAVPLWW